jgi:hypothetical protein
VTTGTGLVEIWAYPNFLNATSNVANLDANDSATQESGGLPGSSGGPVDLSPGRGGTRSLMSTLTEANENPPGTLVLELLDSRVVAIRIEP